MFIIGASTIEIDLTDKAARKFIDTRRPDYISDHHTGACSRTRGPIIVLHACRSGWCVAPAFIRNGGVARVSILFALLRVDVVPDFDSFVLLN